MRSYRLFSSAFLLVLALSAPACSQPERPAQPEPGVLWESRPHPEGDLTYSVQTLARESFPVQIEPTAKVENRRERKSTRLNSSHAASSYAGRCLTLKSA